jgi:hypothetical protein
MEEKSKKSTNTKQAKIEVLLTELKSNNISKIKIALEALKIVGEPSSLSQIVVQLNTNGPSEKNALILEFLSCLKDRKARKVMMDLIQHQDLNALQQLLLSTIWNSPLDYTDYLEVFVELAIKGDFMVSLECLTIIENLDGPFSEKSVMESQVLLGEYADSNPDKNSQKGALMSEIALLIQDFQRLIDVEDDL